MKYQEIKCESSCPCQETKTGSSLDIPAGQWSKSTQKWLTEREIKLLPWPAQFLDLNLWVELKKRVQDRGLWMMERFCKVEWSQIPFSVFCNLIRCYWHLILCCFIGKGSMYKVLNAGVPIIVAHMVLLKIIISYWGISFSHNTFTSIKHWILFHLKGLCQCEIKLIHQTVNFLKPFFTHLYQGSQY